MSSEGGGGGNGSKDRDATVAKTAGFIVFSGIAMSILKTLNPFNNPNPNTEVPCHQSTPSIQQPSKSPLPPPPSPAVQQQPIIKNQSCSTRTIEIVKGDTLWGLSRKYGVTIDAIKEANGIEGDTIYAGKKLVIP